MGLFDGKAERAERIGACADWKDVCLTCLRASTKQQD